MNEDKRDEKVTFWVAYTAFIVVALGTLYRSGSLDNLDLIASLIVVASLLLPAYFINLFIKKNPGIVNKTFRK